MATTTRPPETVRPPAQVEPDQTASTKTAAGWWIDIGSFLTAALLLVQLVIDADWAIRPANALLFALFVPGWTVLRSFGAKFNGLSIAASVGGSIAAFILLGQSLVVVRIWQWEIASIALCALACVLGASNIVAARSERVLHHTRTPTPAAIKWVSWLSFLGGIPLIAYGVGATQREAFGITGLAPELSPAWWAGVGVVILAFVILAAYGSRRCWATLALLVAALHGLPGMIEPHPRFNVAWLHIGFVDQIAENGRLLLRLDGRFSWAGFFSGGGLLQRMAGTEDLLWMVRYAPIFYNGMGVLLTVVIARLLGLTNRQQMAAGGIFALTNWIGQDYFAPQATAFVLYYTVIAAVLWAFPIGRSSGIAAAPAWLRAEPMLHRGPESVRTRTMVLLGVTVVILALVVSHQLTPGFLFSSTALLVLTRHVRLRFLPLFVALAFLAWLSYGADAYWVGHFDKLTGSFGQIGDLLSANVAERTETAVDPGRQLVIRSRIGLALAMWLLAGWSILRGWLWHRTPVVLAVLLIGPFPMLGLQPYGGEMLLRICFFTVVPSAILISKLVVRTVPGQHSWGSRLRVAAAALLLGALLPAFVVARFGNESFEAFSDSDVALARQMYDIVPDSSTVFVADRQTIAFSERVNAVRFRTLPKSSQPDRMAEIRRRHDEGPVYVLLSESQEAHGVVVQGKPDGWVADFITEFEETGKFERVLVAEGGVLLEYTP